MQPAEDEEVPEPDEDVLLEEGIKIARDIVTQASEFGRRRVQRQESAQ